MAIRENVKVSPGFFRPVLHGFRLGHGHLSLLDGLSLGQTAHAAVFEAFALDLGRAFGGFPGYHFHKTSIKPNVECRSP